MTAATATLNTLLTERANIWETTGKPLVDIAATREFTADEAIKWEAAEAGIAGVEGRIRALSTQIAQDEAIAAFQRELDSDENVRKAFAEELRSVLSTRERAAVDYGFVGTDVTRALAVGTPTAGGNVVPTTFLDQFIVPLRNFVSVLDAGATVITTASGENLTIPRLSGFGSATNPVAEAAALSGTDPSFDQTTLKAYKFGDYKLLSRELVEDSAIDIEALVTALIGQNIGLLLGQRLTLGTGTNQTLGLATAATAGKTGATGVAGAPTFDDVIDLFYSVAAPYRTNSSFIIADAALAGIRKLKGSDGQYLWSPSVQLGQPDTILGKAVFADPNLETGLGKKPLLFGDVSAYWVRFVNSIRIERSDQAAFATDQIAFRGVLRADGLLTDPSAVKAFVGGAS